MRKLQVTPTQSSKACPIKGQVAMAGQKVCLFRNLHMFSLNFGHRREGGGRSTDSKLTHTPLVDARLFPLPTTQQLASTCACSPKKKLFPQEQTPPNCDVCWWTPYSSARRGFLESRNCLYIYIYILSARSLPNRFIELSSPPGCFRTRRAAA